MPKAAITYDLNNPDDLVAYKQANQAAAMYNILWELVTNTKKKMENQIEYNKLSPYDVLDRILDDVREQIYDDGINLNL